MMVVTEERPETDEQRGGATPDRRLVVAGAVVAFAAVVVAFWFSWPLGVAFGLVVGVVATAGMVRSMQRVAQAEYAAAADGSDEDLRREFRRLRVRIGDDWPAFSRAAVIVTRSQWASVAGLQRELGGTAAGAQQVMGLLEREGFVGPARGSRRREVLLPPDRADELESLLTL